jgi:hypothetical protein
MGFMILNKDSKPISMNELDREACEFWHPDDPTPDAKFYSSPNGMGFNNWFDVIGWAIHSPKHNNYSSGWNNVKITLWTMHTRRAYSMDLEETIELIKSARRFIEPFYNLIDHWASKSYTPQQTED